MLSKCVYSSPSGPPPPGTLLAQAKFSSSDQGLVVLGTPIGSEAFISSTVETHMKKILENMEKLSELGNRMLPSLC